MKKENAYFLGKVVKTHGLKGELGATFEIDAPGEYLHSDVVFLELQGGLVPHFIERQQFLNNKGILKLEEIDVLEDAQALIGAGIYIPLEDLPELEEGQIYYHNLIGFQVIDDDLGELGEVSNIYDFKSHAVMEMMYKNAEVLVPLHEDIVRDVDPEAQTVYVSLPEGLLDVYLESE